MPQGRCTVGIHVIVIVVLIKGLEFIFFHSACNFLSKNNAGCSFGIHAGDLRPGPGVNKISPQVLAPHGDIGTGIGFSYNDGNLWYCCFGKCVEQLSAFVDHAPFFHFLSNEVGRRVLKHDDGDVKGITETDETGRLLSSLDIDDPSQMIWLICHHTHHPAIQSAVAGNHVSGKVLLHLKKFLAVENMLKNPVHIIGFWGFKRHHTIEFRDSSHGIIIIGKGRGGLLATRGKVVDQQTCRVKDLLFRIPQNIYQTTHLCMHDGAAQFFIADIATCLGLYKGWARDINGTVFGHENEIRKTGGIGLPPCHNSQDNRYLGDHTGIQGIPSEKLAEHLHGSQCFMKPQTPGVTYPDNRHAGFSRSVHEGAYFFPVHLPVGAPQCGEILHINAHLSSVDFAKTRDDALCRNFLFIHAELLVVMCRQDVQFKETLRVQKSFNTFSRCEHALIVKDLLHPLRSSTFPNLFLSLSQGFYLIHSSILNEKNLQI